MFLVSAFIEHEPCNLLLITVNTGQRTTLPYAWMQSVGIFSLDKWQALKLCVAGSMLKMVISSMAALTKVWRVEVTNIREDG